jgi:hypothetical protein
LVRDAVGRETMGDYDRFLKFAREEVAHVGRIAAKLLSEGKIGQGVHDALVCAAGHILKDAYMAGMCEPEGVTDVGAELARIGGA